MTIKDTTSKHRLTNRRPFDEVISALIATAMFVYAAPVKAADQKIELNAGETYVIHELDPGTAPKVLWTDDPNAFVIEPTTNNNVTIVGTEKGHGEIRVKQKGAAVTYRIDVQGVAKPGDLIAPGVTPPAMGAPRFSGGIEKPSKLDHETIAADGSSNGAVPAAPGAESAHASNRTDPSHSTDSFHATDVSDAHSSGSIGTSHIVSAPPDEAVASIPSKSEGGAVTHSQAQLASQGFATPPPTPGSVTYTDDPAVAELNPTENQHSASGKHYLPEELVAIRSKSSRVFDFTSAVRRVAVADTDIADVQVINPYQLMLIGHQSGLTGLTVWFADGEYEERQVKVEKDGPQQVMLNVTIAEVNRTRMEAQGIDYSVALTKAGISLAGLPGAVAAPYGGQIGFINPLSQAQVWPVPGGSTFPLPMSNLITYALSTQNGPFSTNTFFRFLEDHELARVLAQPRLLANSGEESKFLSGGEIPIVVAQALNTSIVFKQFGTSVVFLPTVIGKREVELVVKPEVSEPDFSKGVQLFGFTVPAFVTRRAQTDVRLNDRQTLLIAGLILETTNSKVNKVPYLGDLPVAGALFRNTNYDKVKTELVMSVTPEIVRPIPDYGRLALPTQRPPLTSEEIRTKAVYPEDAARPRLY